MNCLAKFDRRIKYSRNKFDYYRTLCERHCAIKFALLKFRGGCCCNRRKLCIGVSNWKKKFLMSYCNNSDHLSRINFLTRIFLFTRKRLLTKLFCRHEIVGKVTCLFQQNSKFLVRYTRRATFLINVLHPYAIPFISIQTTDLTAFSIWNTNDFV